MALFEWSDDYSVGSDHMDRQHQKLFDIMNRMHDEMKAGADEDRLKKSIAELLNYAVFHFSEEEKQMQVENYSALQAHKQAHKEFIDKMLIYQKVAECGMAILMINEISKTAVDWLKDHILVMDKQYEGQIK